VSAAVHPLEWAEKAAAQEGGRSFALDRPPLLRFMLVKVDSDRHRLVVTIHHILLDGWSMPVLFGELFSLYRNGVDSSVLPPVRPYRDYLRWLDEADRPAARLAWQQALDGVEEPTLIAPAHQQTVPEVPSRLHAGLTVDASQGLHDQARVLGVTANTIVQTAWGVLLSV
ncbi:condensation domain-containing protein, partial [Streptomyces noursei]|uniref:condensation domain-containing protein n=1 Tax=Streptomyces noursei TaxID=1971 RepID=UPI001E560DCC